MANGMRFPRSFAHSGFCCIVTLSVIAAGPPTGPATPPTVAAHEGMILIPAGEFTMGAEDSWTHRNERPAHRVQLKQFWMDATPVTNAQFAKFVEATKYVTIAERPVDWEEIKKQCPPGTPKPPEEMLKPGSLVFTPPSQAVDLRDLSQWWTWTTGADWKHPQGPKSNIEGKDDFPVIQVAWDDAAAYAKWAGKRLPTEAEWEYAARGGAKTNTRYGWGDELIVNGKYMCNTFTGEFPFNNTAKDGFARQSPVRAFPANGYGLFDMAGNVWQWTADLFHDSAHAQSKEEAAKQPTGCCSNPQGPKVAYDSSRQLPSSPQRVIKGGSFLCNPAYCESYRPSARRGTPPDTGSEHVGFRCVKD